MICLLQHYIVASKTLIVEKQGRRQKAHLKGALHQKLRVKVKAFLLEKRPFTPTIFENFWPFSFGKTLYPGPRFALITPAS